MNNLNLENLTEQEREAVLKILTEITQTGTSSTYQDLLYADYKEIPTDIITFIKDNKYLGRAWHLSNGECKLYPYWENKLKELFPDNLTTRYNNFIESGARGLGKAQPLDSLVFTEFGYRKMRDLKVGDLIYGSDGKLHKITHIFPQGIKPTMKVTFSDKTSTLCAEDHLWSYYKIYSKDKTKLYTATCKELYESGVISVSSKTGYKNSKYKIPLVSPIEFQHKDTLISPYMMGLLLGNGHFGKSSVDISTTDYVEYIKQLGLYQKRSWEKFIPKNYLYNDVNSRIELLQGLMDTDGEIGTDYQEKYSTVSKQLAEDIVFLVQSLGGTARITYKTNRTYKYKGQIRSCRDYYDINIKLPKNILPCKLDKKLNNLNPNKLSPIRTIRNIEYVEPQECQCIIIDSEDHLYLTNDLICTHNSEIAITCILYLMHRLMCLKDPYLFLNLKPTEKVAFAFMNITENLSYEIGVTKFQNTVQCSPWFMERGTITGRKDLVWNPPEWIDVIVGSQPRHVVGKPIFGCFFDEISFIPTEDIERQKEKAIDMIDTALGGMKTRFLHKGKNPTLLILASSKRSEKSFLETHTKKKIETEKDNLLLVDEAVWNVHPASDYSGQKFKVALGNKYLASEVIQNENDLKHYIDKGYKILDVPVEFKPNFLENIDRALCDFAGVSASDVTKYISGNRLQTVKNSTIKNAFTKDIIEVGNAPFDKTQYSDFFNLDNIPSKLKNKPLFIHLDMSLSGDRTGIAGVWIQGKKPSVEGQPISKDLFYRLAFSVAVQAPRGYQVSMEKNRQFIRWLRDRGFNIRLITMDSYQSADMLQQLKSEKFDCEIISVDKLNSSKINEPYQYFKNTIYEERIEMYDSDLLTTEILGLERNSSGKIDHPDGGRSGCFTGETKVLLADGRQVTFIDLVNEFNKGKINYTYSYNINTNKIEILPIIKAWCTAKNQPLIRIVFEDNSFVNCTYNHLFLLDTGTYLSAQNLQKDMQIKKLYIDNYADNINYNIMDDLSQYNITNLTTSMSYVKVKEVYYLQNKADVYDITVPQNHNFTLANGIYVHNSKDVSDAVCAAVWAASHRAEEFAFNHGEELEALLKSNNQSSASMKEQITVDFENELKNAFVVNSTDTSKDTKQLDFGLGPAKPVASNSVYIHDGIIVL